MSPAEIRAAVIADLGWTTLSPGEADRYVTATVAALVADGRALRDSETGQLVDVARVVRKVVGLLAEWGGGIDLDDERPYLVNAGLTVGEVEAILGPPPPRGL